MHSPSLGTVFMNPSWWVRSFEVAASASSSQLSPLELSCDSGLTPALNPIELCALGTVLSNVQKQLLSGRTKIILDPVEHRKFVSSTSRSRIFSFERILQILTGLRLLSGSKDEGFEVVPLFKDEVWKRKGFYNGLVIELELSPLGAELIFGFAEPYSEFERFISKKPRAQRHLMAKKPLCLWQSVWLDLQGLEQLIFLRMEEAMQWQNKWLRLEGTFGTSLPQLFDNLQLPNYRSQSERCSPFIMQQRVLERLGRRLMEHGLLTLHQDSEFLALGSDAGEYSLVWQVSPEYLLFRESNFYEAKVAKFLKTHVMEDNLDVLIPVLCGPLYNPSLEAELRKIWKEVNSVEEDDYLGLIQGNLPVFASGLFFEWFIRQMPGHSFGCDSDFFDKELLDLANPSQKSEIAKVFREFLKKVRGRDNILYDLEHNVGLTLISSKTQSYKEHYSYFVQLGHAHASRHGKSGVSGDFHKKSLSEPIVAGKSTEFHNHRPKVPGKALDLKKNAGDELQRLRIHDPKKYQTLKIAFINTLDVEKKKIIEEVMGRLQPKVFDDHLKNSLIKFMVENPESWLPSNQEAHL